MRPCLIETYPDARLISRPGNEERTDAARALLLQQDGRLGDAVQTADARADQNAGALLLVRRIGLPAGVLQSLIGGRHREDDEVIDLALLLRLHPIVGIELAFGQGAARNEATDLAGKIAYIELLDAPGAAFALQQPRPTGFHAAPQGRYEA